MHTRQTVGAMRTRRISARIATWGTTRGFTLIEVLVALAIVAIALGAVLRAIGALAADTDSARQHLLALWSADNALGAVRISSLWPPTGQTTFACPQGPYRFVCRQVVSAMESPLVRQVKVSVYPSASSRIVLAEVVTVVQDEARR
jgi:general secretion pathway protein I